MVSSTELGDRRAGEAGAQPCDGKEAAVEDIEKKWEHNKSLEEINSQSQQEPTNPNVSAQ